MLNKVNKYNVRVVILFGLFSCIQPNDTIDDTTIKIDNKIEIELNIAMTADSLFVLNWKSVDSTMAIVEYGKDSTDIDYYLYNAQEKYRLQHRFEFIDGPEGNFYYRIRLVNTNGIQKVTAFREFPYTIKAKEESPFKLMMINLGDDSGDCIYLGMPGGTDILIDIGGRYTVDLVVAALGGLGVMKIDYFIGTHDHADHMGGFNNFIERMRIHNFLMPDHSERDYYYSEAKSAVEDNGGLVYEISRGQNNETVPFLNWDPAIDVEVWSSGAGNDFPEITYVGTRINNDSPLLKVSYGEFSVVLGGDSENEVHERYVTDVLEINAETDIYKASHHGRIDGNDKKFLQTMNPQTVLISTYDNYSCDGLFQCATLPIFHTVNADVFRTDCASPELNHSQPTKKRNAHIYCISNGEYYIIHLR